MRDLIADGAIGDVVTARAATFFPALGDFYGGDRPWRFDRAAAGGGVVIDTGSHWLRPLRVWLGEVDEVVAALGHPAPRHGGRVALPRAAALRVGRRSPTFDAMLDDRRDREPAALHRDRHAPASCTVEGSGWVKLWDGTDWKGTKVGERGGYLQSYEAELADFASAVLHGTTPAAPRRVRARRAAARARDVPLGRDEAAGRRCGRDRRDVRLRGRARARDRRHVGHRARDRARVRRRRRAT